MKLHLKLNSDAAFGRGDGVAGLVDAELEHDEYGLPFLHGRALKGLLVEECANILFALRNTVAAKTRLQLMQTAQWLFGRSGTDMDSQGNLHFGNACLPSDLCHAVAYEIDNGRWTRADVLDSLTAIRRQTAMTKDGTPEKGSLRSIRVLLRGTVLCSDLSFAQAPAPTALQLLAACVLSLRRAGTGRNRGTGRLEMLLDNDLRKTLWYCRRFELFLKKGTGS